MTAQKPVPRNDVRIRREGGHTPEDPASDPRDREPADEAPATPTDEPPPVPVQDPPVSEPRAPYTVTKDDIKK